MKTFSTAFFIFIAVALSVQATGQSKPEIKINTKFVLKLVKTDPGFYSCSIVSEEPFNEVPELKDARHYLHRELKGDEIEGVFAYAKFGGKESIFLILKSGFSEPLKYDLYINQKDAKDIEKTSTTNLYPNVPSTEIWPFDIERILFSDFQITRR